MNLKKVINKYSVDKVLVIALFIGLIFCLYGINWGKVESWHPDQMVFKSLFHKGKLPLNPGWFGKPPFHTYFNFFLSKAPIYIIGEKNLNIPRIELRPLYLIWSRFLTVFLFLGSVSLVFKITRRFFGIFSSRIITLIFASSAGFIAYSHFLTTDIPVMFWMLVALYFSQNIFLRGKISDYVFAGFFTGIATATKYNGLAIGINIVVAHLLTLSPISWKSIPWKELFLSKKLLVGLSMVVSGFVIGNPFSVLDYSTFISDFLYNFTVTPVYGGETGHSYWKFFSRIIEIIGFPSFIFFAIACLFSLYLAFINRGQRLQIGGILLVLSAGLLYYYKFGSFPRLPTRFVLPIVPLWLIMSGPFWNKLKPNKIALSLVLIVAISYNVACSFYVGKRFSEDPRMVAQEWVKENIPENSYIESSGYTPKWNKIPGVKLRQKNLPFIDGRRRLFEQLFKDNPEILKELKGEATKENLIIAQWYSLEQLRKRRPDYIAIDSLYYQRFLESKSDLYPSMNQFFQDLLNEKYPYKIVFDQESKVPPAWVYPQQIDFLHNRIIIFARKES
ncbi:MAG: hypothetical protein F6K58_27365 [Symploca sp. SIO2E9]|nr:hypothetical protein [Symploca sp. SIO2E9]